MKHDSGSYTWSLLPAERPKFLSGTRASMQCVNVLVTLNNRASTPSPVNVGTPCVQYILFL